MSAAHAGGSRRRRKAATGRPVPVGEAMRELLGELGLAAKVAGYDLVAIWPDVVGSQIARVTTAERVENGVLYVAVTTAPWRAELSLQRAALLEKLNGRAGRKVLTDIRFR